MKPKLTALTLINQLHNLFFCSVISIKVKRYLNFCRKEIKRDKLQINFVLKFILELKITIFGTIIAIFNRLVVVLYGYFALIKSFYDLIEEESSRNWD